VWRREKAAHAKVAQTYCGWSESGRSENRGGGVWRGRRTGEETDDKREPRLREEPGASDDAGALVERIKARAIADTRTLTGKDQYEVGDISRAVASSLRRELSARLSSGEWDLEDLSLLLRTVLLLGAKVSPAARLLPVQALIQAYSAQLASELGERTVAEVVNRLQSKLYEGASSAVGSYTGKEKYELGDITKKAVADLTGKDVGQYQFGDITRTIAGKFFGGDEKDAGDDKTRKPNS